MSNQNFIKKLLDGSAVEWQPLSEGEDKLTELRRGRVMSKGYLVENSGDYPVYSSQTANNGEIGSIGTFDFDGEFISWTTDGANAGTVFHRTDKFSITNVCGLIKINNEEKLNYKFLFYWLSIVAKKYVYSGMGNPKLMSNQMGKILIPIPSLEIQEKIVRILDTFTELTTKLTTELTTELATHKKRYTYYRDKLLSFEDEEVEWEKLEKILVRTKGTKITAGRMKELHKEKAPLKIFAGGKTVAFVDFNDIPKKDINKEPSIIVKSRGVIEFEYYDKPFSHKNEMWSYHSTNNNLNIKYVYYFLKINEPYFRNLGSRMQMPQISIPDTEKFKIPIPRIEVQERIITILDKFDDLTNSISEELSREIELRQKQYEYYRNMLLSFPKEEA